MDRLKAVSTGIGQPLRPEDWQFIQNQTVETIMGIISGLIDPLPRCIISGCEVNVDGENVIVSDGMFFDGEEVCIVHAATFEYNGDAIIKALDGSGGWYLFLTPSVTTGETRTFKDSSTHDVYEYRRYELGYAEAIPEGSIGLAPIKTLLYLITKHVLDLIPAQATSIDIKEKKVTFNLDNLDQYMELIPDPGAGKTIQVIACCGKIHVSSQINVGTQNLNVTYGTDITTPGIGYFPNGFLENPITTISEMVNMPDYMYEHQAVNVGLSGETRPSAGSAVIDINVIYKIIEF